MTERDPHSDPRQTRLMAGAICLLFAALWIGGGILYAIASLGFAGFFRLAPQEFATVVVAILLPPALLALAVPRWLDSLSPARPAASVLDHGKLETQLRALSEAAHAAQARIGATLRDMDERVDRLHRTIEDLAKPAAALTAVGANFDSGVARLVGFDASGTALGQRIETLITVLARIDTLARELKHSGDAARDTARQMETMRAGVAEAGEAAATRIEHSARLLEERSQTTAAVGNAVASRLVDAERRLADLEQSLARQMAALDSLAERVRDTAGSLAAEAERLRVGGVRVDPFRRKS